MFLDPPFLYLKQIGSRITSKRICQMLDACVPFSYIMVDKNPNRQDPSHIVTHRIQSSIVGFVDFLLKARVPHLWSDWATPLQVLSKMVKCIFIFNDPRFLDNMSINVNVFCFVMINLHLYNPYPCFMVTQ